MRIIVRTGRRSVLLEGVTLVREANGALIVHHARGVSTWLRGQWLTWTECES